ncbi:MAG: hypothetical protein C0501_00825 [Isosphaera sp.]|nr:hypothetical protein [Isosphaera sp.]
MSAFPRRLAALAALAAPAAGVAAAAVLRPEWSAAVGLDVWNVPALRAESRAEAERAEVLADEDQDIRRRIAVKEALVSDLIAGRATLAAVTARFVELNRARPEYVAAVRANYPGDTDEEKTARNVLEYASGRIAAEPPARRAEVTARLRAELAGLDSPDPAGAR